MAEPRLDGRLDGSLYLRVCTINGATFLIAAVVLAVSPATVSAQVTVREWMVLLVGSVVVVLVNALVLRQLLRPLDRLSLELRQLDATDFTARLAVPGRSGVQRTFAVSFNELLDRLAAEQLTAEMRARAAEEAERRRIARELHDDVGQRLTVVLLGARRLARRAGPWDQEELRLLQENTRESLELVRGVAEGLRGGVWDDMDLPGALTALTTEFARAHGIRVIRKFDADLPDVDPAVHQAVFRVAQESLTNVARHACARTVAVLLRRHDRCAGSCLVLTVTDDGVGYDTAAVGHGIVGMRERARTIGGTLIVERALERGTRVRLEVPLAQEAGA